jgi:hypothetical protein
LDKSCRTICGFLTKNNDMKLFKFPSLQICGKFYKTFYGRNYVAIGVTQTKS